MGVFITDGDQRATLAVVRALGRAGISVTVGDRRSECLAGRSRFCARTLCYPSPWTEPARFQVFVRNEVLSSRYRVLLPMTDVTMQVLGEAREALAPYVRLPIPEGEKINLAQDKQQILLIAQRIGIPAPKSFMPHDQETLEDISRRVTYPVVLKPRFTWLYQDGHWALGSVCYATNPDDLITKYQNIHSQVPNPLIQERIEGEGRGVFLLLWNGEVKAAFCHRRLREKPPSGGVSVYCESVPLDWNLVDRSVRLLQTIGWQGVAMVEYKVDRQDHEAKLMEVNGRFWGSLQLAIDAGINFPLLLYRLAIEEKVPSQFDYKVGVKSRWLLGDLDHLWMRLTHSNAANGSRHQIGSRLKACADFLKFHERDVHYEVLRLDDPGPGWFECKAYVREALRAMTQAGEGNHDR